MIYGVEIDREGRCIHYHGPTDIIANRCAKCLKFYACYKYGEKTMKVLDKAVILCSAGNPLERLEEFGLLDSMKRVMLGDRLFGRVKQTEFVVFDNTSRENELREKNWDKNLQKAYEMGKELWTSKKV